MKTPVLLRLILGLTLAVGAMTPAVHIFRDGSTIALADSAASPNNTPEEAVPLTDRVPWLIYVVLTGSSLALAWILFSLARAKMKDAGPDDEKPT